MRVQTSPSPAHGATMTNSWLERTIPSPPICFADVYPDPCSLKEIRIAMASSQSPPNQAIGYGSGQSENGKSALSMSLGFLKNLTEKKGTRGMIQPV